MTNKSGAKFFQFPIKQQVFWLCLLFIAFTEKVAQAGMSVLELSDLAKFRMESISFFLAGFLVSSFIIYRLWNYLRKDFSFLPLLSYQKSVVLTGLWGLVVLIVLTMISGARELMTPGAWTKKDGASTYVLADQKKPAQSNEQNSSQILLTQRKSQLKMLQGALWLYASKNDGIFPKSVEDSKIPEEDWKLPEKYELKYQYIPGLKPAENSEIEIVVIELNVYDDNPFALYNDGTIKQVSKEKWIELQQKGNEK